MCFRQFGSKLHHFSYLKVTCSALNLKHSGWALSLTWSSRRKIFLLHWKFHHCRKKEVASEASTASVSLQLWNFFFSSLPSNSAKKFGSCRSWPLGLTDHPLLLAFSLKTPHFVRKTENLLWSALISQGYPVLTPNFETTILSPLLFPLSSFPSPFSSLCGYADTLKIILLESRIILSGGFGR